MVAPSGWDFFALAEGRGLGLSSGLGDSSGVALGEGLGDSLGDGEGEAFFFFPVGEGEGDRFGLGVGLSFSSGVGLGVGLFFAELLLRLGEALGDGEGEIFFFGEGLADGSGVAFSLGDGVGVDFFLVDALRFFGGGVGWKMRFSFVPKSSSARAERTPPPMISAPASRKESARLVARRLTWLVRAGWLCSGECPHPDFPAGSSR